MPRRTSTRLAQKAPVNEDITVAEYLQQQCEEQSARLMQHATHRIRQFEEQAKVIRAELEAQLRASGEF